MLNQTTDERRLTGCEGKDPMTAPQAKKCAARMRRKQKPVDAYKCSFCLKWHVGNPNLNRSRS